MIKYCWDEDLEIHEFYWNRFLNVIRNEIIHFSNKTVLDIGCDISSITSKLAKGIRKNNKLQIPLKVIGVDSDVESINKAKVNNNMVQNMEFKPCDINLGLPFDNKSFYIIISTNVLHNFKSGVKEKLVNEISRVLKTNAQLILIDVIFFNSSERYLCSHIDCIIDIIENEVHNLSKSAKWRLTEIVIRDDSPFNLLMTEKEEYPESLDYMIC